METRITGFCVLKYLYCVVFLVSYGVCAHNITLLPREKKETTAELLFDHADNSVWIDLAPTINGVSLNHFSSFSLDNSPLTIESEDKPKIIILRVEGDQPSTIQNIDSLGISTLQGSSHKIYIINPHGINCNNCTFRSNVGLSSHALDEEELKAGKIKWKNQQGFIQITGPFTAYGDASFETEVLDWQAEKAFINGTAWLYGRHGTFRNPLVASDLRLKGDYLDILSNAYLSGAEKVAIEAKNLTHAGTTVSPQIFIKADHILVKSDNSDHGIFAQPVERNPESIEGCLEAMLDMKIRVRLDNWAVIHSAGSLHIDALNIKNEHGIIHGCASTKIGAQWFYNLEGQIVSDGTLTIEGQNNTQSPYVRNEKGQIISGKAMTIDAKEVVNAAAVPIPWRQPHVVELPVLLLQENGATRSTMMKAKISYLFLKEHIKESLFRSHDTMIFTGDLITNHYGQIWARQFPPRPSDQRSIVDLVENIAFALTSTVELIPGDLDRRVEYTGFFGLEWDHRRYCVSGTLKRLGQCQVKRILFDKSHPLILSTPHIPEFCEIIGDLNNDQACSIKCKPYPYATVTSSISADEKIEGKVNQVRQKMLYRDENGVVQETLFQTRFFSKDDIKPSDQVILLDDYFKAFKKQQHLYVSSVLPDEAGVRYDLAPAWRSNYDLPFDSSVALKLLAQAAGRITNLYLPAHPLIEQIVVETAIARPLGYKRYSYLDILQNGHTYAIQNKWGLGIPPTAEQLKAMPEGTVILSYLFSNGQNDAAGYMPIIYVDASTAATMKSQVGPAIAAAALDLEIQERIENKGRLVAFGGDAYLYSNGQLHIQCGSFEVSGDLAIAAKNGKGLIEGCKQKNLLGNGITHEEDIPVQLAVAGTLNVASSENFDFRNIQADLGNLNINLGNQTNPANLTISPGMDRFEDNRSNTQNHDYFGFGSNSTSESSTAHYEQVKPSFINVDGTISGNVNGGIYNKASTLRAKKINMFSSKGFYNIPMAQEKLSKESMLNTVFGLGFTLSWEEISVSLGGAATQNSQEKKIREHIKASVIAEEGGEIRSDEVIENQAGLFSGLNLVAPKVRFICARDSRNETSSTNNAHAGVSAGVKQNLSRGFKRIASIADKNHTTAEDRFNAGADALRGGAEIVAALEDPGRAGVWMGAGVSHAEEMLQEALANCASYEAKNNTIQTDELETEGTHITGSGLRILAKRWKNLIEAKNEFHALRSQLGADATVQLYGLGNPVSMGVSGMFHNTDQEITPYTTLEIEGKLEIDIEEQADLTGVQIRAKDIEATFTDLLLASLQNTLTERGFHAELSVSASPATIAKAASFAMGGGGAGGTVRDRKWTDQLAFIIGTERAKITVKNMLKMTGSLIANAERDENGTITDKGKLQLVAAKLISQDLEDLDQGGTLGAGYEAGSTASVPGAFTAEFGILNRQRTVRSTVGAGDVNISEGAENIKRNVSEIFETKADFEIKPIHIYIPRFNFNAIADVASYRLQQISRVAGDAARIFRHIEFCLDERAQIRASAAKTREQQKEAAAEKAKAEKSGDKGKAHTAAYQEMLVEQEGNLKEQVEKCQTVLD